MVTAQHEAVQRSLRRCAARPTLRVLRYDLHLPVPPIDELLEEIDHPLLTKARDQFAVDDAAHERYTHVFLASPVEQSGPARLDTEIEKYFDISVVLLPARKRWTASGPPSPAWEPSAP